MPEGLTITCASRSLPLTGTGTLSATQNLHSLVAEGGIRRRERKQSSDAINKEDSPNVA
jgi:hypothetical protein